MWSLQTSLSHGDVGPSGIEIICMAESFRVFQNLDITSKNLHGYQISENSVLIGFMHWKLDRFCSNVHFMIIIIIMNHFYKAHITIYISSLCALGRKRTEKRTV